jgi:ankyrin repeat protein
VEALSAERNVTARDVNGRTPLHYAAQMGDLPAAKWLVDEKNADDHSRPDIFGLTPLHIATEQGHLEMVKWLVGKKADVNARDRREYTPLHEAVLIGDFEMVKWLIEVGNAVVDDSIVLATGESSEDTVELLRRHHAGSQ